MKKILVFGTFDILHPGHKSFLKQAKDLGEFLVVVIGRDQTIERIKGQSPDNNEYERLDSIQKLKMVNWAVLGYLKDYYKIIEDTKPDIIALGYDQTTFTDNLEKELKKRNLDCKIVRLNSFKPEKYKTSKLRNKTGE